MIFVTNPHSYIELKIYKFLSPVCIVEGIEYRLGMTHIRRSTQRFSELLNDQHLLKCKDISLDPVFGIQPKPTKCVLVNFKLSRMTLSFHIVCCDSVNVASADSDVKYEFDNKVSTIKFSFFF